MTLPSEVKELIMKQFPAAFSNSLILELNDSAPVVAIVDFMQFVKYIPPNDLTIRSQLINYFVSRAIEILIEHPTIETLIILVDQDPMDSKRAVAHQKRHAESDTKPLPTNGGPYLPPRDHDTIMTSERWTAFAKNFLLLRRELYPLLFNAFMSMRGFKLRLNQRIVLSGFPGRSSWETVHHSAPWEARRNDENRQYVVHQWEHLPITADMERADPELYHRTYVVEQRDTGIVQYELERGKSNISEADIRMYWFAHFYPRQHVLFYVNDGDAISIGALMAHERLHSIAPIERSYVYHNRHTIMLPNKSKDAKTKYTYVDLNKFYALVREYPPMRHAGVQNHVITLVALITMAGCDFFNKFLFDMGFTSIIWNTFFSNIAMLTHTFMMSEISPASLDLRVYRTIVVDESSFARFISLCFAAKYSKDLTKKRLKHDPDLDDIRDRAMKNAKGEIRDDPRYAFPKQNEIRAYSRAVLWVLEYWKNGPQGYIPDCMELWYGMPYYPFWKNPATLEPEFITLVSPTKKPVDEVFTKQHKRIDVIAAHQFSQEYMKRDTASDPKVSCSIHLQ